MCLAYFSDTLFQLRIIYMSYRQVLTLSTILSSF